MKQYVLRWLNRYFSFQCWFRIILASLIQSQVNHVEIQLALFPVIPFSCFLCSITRFFVYVAVLTGSSFWNRHLFIFNIAFNILLLLRIRKKEHSHKILWILQLINVRVQLREYGCVVMRVNNITRWPPPKWVMSIFGR